MPNYKEVATEGTSYTRCRIVMIHNECEDQPVVEFHEESVVTFGGQTFRQPTGSCSVLVVPSKTITVLDPVSGAATGELVTHERLYQLLYSAYIQTALERDAE